MMKFFLLSVIFLLISGCGDTPAPHADKSAKTTQEIQNNISEAEKARKEYLALQRRRKEDRLYSN